MVDQFAKLRTRYTVDAADNAWLRKAAAELSAMPAADRFRGTLDLLSDPGASIEYETVAAWTTGVDERFADASQAQLEIWSGTATWKLEVDLKTRQVELVAWRGPADTAQATRDALATALGLRALAEATDPNSPRQGIRQQFQVGAGGVTGTWLTAALNLLSGEIDTTRRITGRCRLVKNPTVEAVFEDWSAFRAAIEENFTKGELASFYLWAWSDGNELTCECDVRRELVTLEVKRGQRSDVDQAVLRLSTGMSLEQLSRQPYMLRRYTRVYRLNKWTSASDFLAGLDNSVALAFPRPPAVAEANVTRGTDTLDREPATNLEAFRKLVADAGDNLTGLYLVLEGLGGRYLGMALRRQEARFEMWTSLGRSDWGPVAKALEDALEIELKEERKARDADKSGSWQPEVLKMVAAALLASGGTYCTTEGVQLWMSHPQVTITSPPMLDDKSSSPTEGAVRVAWTVTTNRWKNAKLIQPPPSATVVVQDASGVRLVDTANVRSGTMFQIPAGDFDITVTIDSLGVNQRLTMHVKDSVEARAKRSR